jgi:Fe-S-cluster-containing dehydrogenase component
LEEVNKMGKDYGILVDVERCLGCGVCVTACKQENDLPPHIDDVPGKMGTSWNQVLAISEGKYPNFWEYTFPVHCMHCKNPPCIPSCPQEAINKNDNGIVLISEDKCDACENETDKLRKCENACPYHAIQFNPEKGVAQACTLCAHRVDAGVEPACVRACIGRCMTFGDFGNPDSEISKQAAKAGDRLFVLGEEKNTHPSLKYINPCRPHNVRVDKISPLTRVKIAYGYNSSYNKPTQ